MTASHPDDHPLLRAMPRASAERLAAGSMSRRYARNATIFRAGTPAAGVHLVVQGTVRVVRAVDGRQHVVHSEGPGGTLGEVPVFTGGTYPATALAAEPVRCLLVPAPLLRRAVEGDPALAWFFLERLSLRVRDLVGRLDGMAAESVGTRLTRHLIERADAAGGGPFTLGETQAALAEELGTVREVVVRALGRLARDGIIRRVGRGRYELVGQPPLVRP